MIGTRIAFSLLVVVGWITTSEAQQVPGCGSLSNAYGPFDYRDPVAKEKSLPIVEAYHFTPDVQNLVRGKTSTHVLDDLDYTLRAFPNHYHALHSVSKYALQGGSFPTDGRIRSAECYLKRAVAFRPDDGVVHGLYGDYLAKRGDNAGARSQYEEALRLAPESVEISYNAGLFFVDQGELEKARQLAKIAYDGGYPLPGLRNKILQAESKSRR